MKQSVEITARIMNGYNEFVNLEKSMNRTNSLEELKEFIVALNRCYDDVLSQLYYFRTSDYEGFLKLDKVIIKNISRKKAIIIRNLERLDPDFDYEHGGLDEKED